jgi:predicted transcriptional regulator
MKLKPSERMVLLALRITPNQSVTQVAEMLGVKTKFHVADALRVLFTLGLITRDKSVTPHTFALAAPEGSDVK